MDPSEHPSGLYEVVWMDDDGVPRRRRYVCLSDDISDVYAGGKDMAEHSRFGSRYVITVRETTPDW